jgi:hypothetical protein
MADNPNATVDVTIYSPDGGSGATVNSDSELRVSDDILRTGDLWQRETNNGKGFSVITPDITISSSAESDLFIVRNPNASGKLIRFNEFMMTARKGTGQVVGDFRVYRNPTITANGTSVAIQKIKPSQSASSVCSAYHSPTISARGTLINKFSIDVNHTEHRLISLGRYLEANNNQLITFEPQTGGTIISFFANWIEQ